MNRILIEEEAEARERAFLSFSSKESQAILLEDPSVFLRDELPKRMEKAASDSTIPYQEFRKGWEPPPEAGLDFRMVVISLTWKSFQKIHASSYPYGKIPKAGKFSPEQKFLLKFIADFYERLFSREIERQWPEG